MSLLSDAKKETAPVAEEAGTTKKHSNSEYQKRQREHQFKAACAIRDFIKSKNITLPEDLQAEMDFLCKEKKAVAGGAFGTPVIYKLFGNTPKKGDKITAMDMFNKTGKGFSDMRQQMKKWEKAGIIVKYDEKAKSFVLDSDVPAYQG